jgi:hypothetical protein
MNTAAGTSVFDQGAQSIFDQAVMSPLELEELEMERIRHQAFHLAPGWKKIEEELDSRCWWAYRTPMFEAGIFPRHVERTRAFVRAFDSVMLGQHLTFAFDNSRKSRSRPSYLKPSEISIPWLDAKKVKGRRQISLSRRWDRWQAARRSADVRGYDYDEYVAAALQASRMRGWKHLHAEHLANEKLLGRKVDGYADATIPAIVEAKLSANVRFCSDPYFTADAWTGDPVQMAYARYAAGELVKRYGLTDRARQAFRSYKRDGKFHASLEFDALIQ